MPRVCTICTHKQRATIDQALLDGVALRTIADRWSVSKTALLRHNAEHIPPHLARAKDAKEVAQVDSLLAQVRAAHERLERLWSIAENILAKAYNANDYRAALEAIRTASTVSKEMRGYLDLLGELEGALNRRPQVNLTISAEWLEVRAVLLQVLTPYPEARAAVARALLEVEQ